MFWQRNFIRNPTPLILFVSSIDFFSSTRNFEEADRMEAGVNSHGCLSGSVIAIREAGGETIPSVYMHAPSGGRVDDAVLDYLKTTLNGPLKELTIRQREW